MTPVPGTEPCAPGARLLVPEAGPITTKAVQYVPEAGLNTPQTGAPAPGAKHPTPVISPLSPQEVSMSMEPPFGSGCFGHPEIWGPA